MRAFPSRPRSTLFAVLLLWFCFYASFTLFTPTLLDDADSVHAEVAREMLLRHDYVTLYANGIRYLEKAPLLYWSMAACMKVFILFGADTPHTLAAAARLPLAFAVLALALLCEAFARRLFQSVHAGLYAALIVLSSFGIFIFTRILIPDAMVCLWLSLALYAFWRNDEVATNSRIIPRPSSRPEASEIHRIGAISPFLQSIFEQRWPLLFAVACALNILTKGLIGLVFPIAIVSLYLLLIVGLGETPQRLRALFPWTAVLVFFVIAAPWHILAGLANPTQGYPAAFHFIDGHWQTPLPTDGNVRGWFWFYFINEHLLRYLNLRVPHDYDTSPLWLFWGLYLVWIFPWSAFALQITWRLLRKALEIVGLRLRPGSVQTHLDVHGPKVGAFLLFLCIAFVLLFFSVSTRQEYYVLPALPALAILVAGLLASGDTHNRSSLHLAESSREPIDAAIQRPWWHDRATISLIFLLVLGSLFAIAAGWLLMHTQTPAQNIDLASLLTQNPADYALSMGHFLDLNARALGLFRLPLSLAASGLLAGPLVALLLRRRGHPNAANLGLAGGTFCFLLAAFLALRTFAPVLSSAQLADHIKPQIRSGDLIVIHGEYEAGSTLGFYLQRDDIHILEGRSSNLWYGSFFPDAPHIFETSQSIAQKWKGPQRIFLWQSTTDEPHNLPPVSGPVYVIAVSGGKEIVSNQPTR